MNFTRKMFETATTSGVQVNKYYRMGLSAIVMILGWALAFDWTKVLEPKTAGTVMGIIGFIKFVYAFVAPTPGTPTQPVGNNTSLITSQGVPGPAPTTTVPTVPPLSGG